MYKSLPHSGADFECIKEPWGTSESYHIEGTLVDVKLQLQWKPQD